MRINQNIKKIQFHMGITKFIQNLTIQCENYETHETFKIQFENHENLANPKI